MLDFGCGTGSYAVAAARRVGEQGRVYAVDRNPVRVEQVRHLAARHGIGNLHTMVSDCHTGLESGTVDLVLLYDVLHGLENPARVLAELVRVLRPGGLLSVRDHHLSEVQIVAALTTPGGLRLVGRGRSTCSFVREEPTT